jgi:hypothetical protein
MNTTKGFVENDLSCRSTDRKYTLQLVIHLAKYKEPNKLRERCSIS